MKDVPYLAGQMTAKLNHLNGQREREREREMASFHRRQTFPRTSKNVNYLDFLQTSSVCPYRI